MAVKKKAPPKPSTSTKPVQAQKKAGSRPSNRQTASATPTDPGRGNGLDDGTGDRPRRADGRLKPLGPFVVWNEDRDAALLRYARKMVSDPDADLLVAQLRADPAFSGTDSKGRKIADGLTPAKVRQRLSDLRKSGVKGTPDFRTGGRYKVDPEYLNSLAEA